ncbi:MAG: alpha-L-fucosidase [Bacteroidetes bacterium]|uniref:alpha-L-fucosidase n=1 Tax=Candidatus Cryptobacteroides faecavium TaxID=2840762 RepID=A0A9D9NFT5_9BACT|nr:alpha-L-fucosidase [Candidatus Cryptobacteroides faecavium]
MKHLLVFVMALMLCADGYSAGDSTGKSRLLELQQDFVDLKFGMFIHFNMPTFWDADWPDPDADKDVFNPAGMDCSQWAEAAKSAKMRYGCLTTKHHSGFCIWDTETTDYSVGSNVFGRDVVKEFADAFRKEGLEVMLYYSILDMHHGIRPGCISREHVEFIKDQLTELLTGYGKISALIIDGWDAPWSRISYEEVPFAEIYRLVKRLQPDCLVMDLNAAKYPAAGLFYTDIKSYEQNAGQHISTRENRLPALSCLPLQQNWFWKTSFPATPVKDPRVLVEDNLVPFNRAHCNFILNVAPNSEGLLDGNAVEALAEIGRLWDDAEEIPGLDPSAVGMPVIAENVAKFQRANSSWSDDYAIMDFGNDDDFGTAWRSSPSVDEPWYEVEFFRDRPVNAVCIVDRERSIRSYRLMYESAGEWKEILRREDDGREIKLERFGRIYGSKIRVEIVESNRAPSIWEFCVYDEQ